MHPLRTLIFAGAAVIATAGVAAAAQHANLHVLKLQLPGGGSEVIRYTGDVAPQVTVSDRPLMAPFAAFPGTGAMALEPSAFDWNAPLVMLRRMQAEMQRQAAAVLQQARAAQAATGANPQQFVVFGAPGAGQGFSLLSTASASGVCARSVQITAFGDGKPAKVVSKTYGDCAETRHSPDAASTAAADPAARHLNAVPVNTAPRARAPSEQSVRVGV